MSEHTIRVGRETYEIVTKHVYPPIPDRRNDWCAYVRGREEDGVYGWGATELDAVNSLEAMLEPF